MAHGSFKSGAMISIPVFDIYPAKLLRLDALVGALLQARPGHDR
jgi:hypothetical protein